jgi:hypothetical protein
MENKELDYMSNKEFLKRFFSLKSIIGGFAVFGLGVFAYGILNNLQEIEKFIYNLIN